MVSIGASPNMMVDFQSYAGPGDRGLRNTELEGYQPVSRIGEVAMNAFVDSYEFTVIADTLRQDQLKGDPTNAAAPVVEFKPHFHEWATVQPGMICLARKKKTAVFRQYVAAETAVPTARDSPSPSTTTPERAIAARSAAPSGSRRCSFVERETLTRWSCSLRRCSSTFFSRNTRTAASCCCCTSRTYV